MIIIKKCNVEQKNRETHLQLLFSNIYSIGKYISNIILS